MIDALQDLAFKHPSYGFRKLFAYTRRAGNVWNHKKVYRVYKLLKLNRKRKGKRRLPARVKQPLATQTTINKIWSMDFMSDSVVSGRRFRTFNLMDEAHKEESNERHYAFIRGAKWMRDKIGGNNEQE